MARGRRDPGLPPGRQVPRFRSPRPARFQGSRRHVHVRPGPVRGPGRRGLSLHQALPHEG
ncbi:MAG: hypothetical protein LBT40_18490 [Deltaproteobacteria bacterium]|nr:hypothetical protein [Deltaproteobacteria bacterium]